MASPQANFPEIGAQVVDFMDKTLRRLLCIDEGQNKAVQTDESYLWEESKKFHLQPFKFNPVYSQGTLLCIFIRPPRLIQILK